MFSIKKMGNMPGSSSLHRHHKFASFRNGYYVKLNVDKPLYGKIKVMSLARGLCVPVPGLFVEPIRGVFNLHMGERSVYVVASSSLVLQTRPCSVSQ